MAYFTAYGSKVTKATKDTKVMAVIVRGL